MGSHPLTWAAAKKAGWLFSPKLAAWQLRVVRELKQRLPLNRDGLWILSSGTSSVGEVKAIGVTHAAVLASAAAVNKHLQSTKADRWLLNLPTYHVGGLGILARAHLSGARVVRQIKWNARDFADLVTINKITLSALVPTQVHDLIALGLKSPDSLRAIVVGGGALDPALYARARALGWPLLPSYGLTECCSQVATASLGSLKHQDFPGLKILDHAEIKLREGRIFVRARSACSWVARGGRDGSFSLEDPLRGGWLPTEDLGEWRGSELRVIGRRDDIVKIMGVLVSVNEVEHEARNFFQALGGDLTLFAIPGGREGHRLILVTDATTPLVQWERHRHEFNARVPGPQRILAWGWVPKIPRGDLGKVKRAALIAEMRLC